MSFLCELIKGVSLTQLVIPYKLPQASFVPVRSLNASFKPKERKTFTEKPKPGAGKAYRRTVHFPKDYTVEPLNVTNLGGRDPVTGRKVCQKIGGGIKHKYHWIKWFRDGPFEGPPQEEKVMRIFKCGCRTANVALVAVKDEIKYILATQNMKPGDIIRTSRYIPRNTVRPNEGDAYPVGALPPGTIVHNVQLHPSVEYTAIHSAGSFGILKRQTLDKVILQLPSKKEFALEPECMATVGRLSNVEHGSTPIGSAQKARELGIRPSSGLWHRKTGKSGRKIKKISGVKEFEVNVKPKPEIIQCTLSHIKS